MSMSITLQTVQMRCAECNFLFDGEMVSDAPFNVVVASMKAMHCPNCSAGYKKLLMGQGRTIEEDRRFEIGTSLQERTKLWLENGEKGLSASCIHAFMTGRARTSDYPRDAGDFRRCELLLSRVPEWRERMPDMAVIGGAWERLGPAWKDLSIAFVEDVGPELNRVPAPAFARRFAALLEGIA